MSRQSDSTGLFAAGFNAFQQLTDGDAKQDVTKFEHFPRHQNLPSSVSSDGENAELFHSSWSSTAFTTATRLHSVGFQSFTTDLPTQESGGKLICPFGDHNGLIGCLDTSGRVYYLTPCDPNSRSGERTTPLVSASTADSPPLSHIARANNERVAVTFKQAPNAKLTHIAEFESIESFQKWHSDPAGEGNYPAAHHMLSGRPKQLLANAATFVLLMETNEVYTWGDPRFRTLARPTTGEGAVPASEPGVVEALGGLQIDRLKCGGWLYAALSDGAAYLWGISAPGGEGTIQHLKDAGDPGAVILIDIPTNDSEFSDILDVAVGDNHVAVIVDDGRLFTVGENRNGQLGLASDRTFVEEYTVVDLPNKARTVSCGPKATFVS